MRSVANICIADLRRVKTRRTLFFVSTDLSPEATKAAWDAELRLEHLTAYEDVAEFFDAATVLSDREKFAASYRRLVGVHPEHRQEFREALERIRDGGGMPVDELIAEFNRQ